MLTIAECLTFSESLLAVSDSPRIDVEVLLAWVLKKNRTYLYTWPEKTLSTEQEVQFRNKLAERKKGQPIAYITGEKEFWSLSLEVNNSTLIPRPDTELLVEIALNNVVRDSGRSQNRLNILDLGTGTGAIALALAIELPDADILAVDKSCDAIELAQKNALKHGMENVTVKLSNWYDNIGDRQFDLIVSNPPYVDANDSHLNCGDVMFEPHSALVSEENGLADIRKIIMQSPKYLRVNGWVLVEHGFAQACQVREFFRECLFQDVKTEKDLNGHERATLGKYIGLNKHER